MSAIEATTVKCATLVDGTLRLTLDIEPMHALAAFQLFGQPGRAVGIAALRDAREQMEQPQPQQRVSRVMSDEQREAARARWGELGTLCKTAVMWCSTPEFQEWLGVANAQEAGDKVKEVCVIDSRKELDDDPQAAIRFKQRVIAPYQRYMMARAHAQHHD